MDTAQTAGIVIVTVAIVQGLIGLVKYIINKQKESKEEISQGHIEDKLDIISEKLNNTCLTDVERDQLKSLYDMHARYDGNGVPMWYVPRSWADINKEMAEKLQTIGEVQLKMLVIIERLERRIEILDKPGGN